MTDFKGHLKIGVCAAIFSGSAALYAGFSLDPVLVFSGAIIITSVLPDVDIHSSKPRQFLGTILLMGGIVGAVWVGFNRRSLVEFIGGWISSIVGLGAEIASSTVWIILVLAGGGVAMVAGKLLDEMTTHRGITHTLGFGVVLGSILAGSLAWHGIGQNLTLLVGIAPVIGVGAHVYIGDR